MVDSEDSGRVGPASQIAAPTENPLEARGTTSSKGVGIERTFPIRVQAPSRVSRQQETEDAAATLRECVDGRSNPVAPTLATDVPLRPISQPAAPLVSAVQVSKEEPRPGLRYITNRFSYFPHSKSNSTAHSLASQNIYRCEDEPIHTPGAIQRFGALIAVREYAGTFLVRVVSENSQSVISLEPEALFELRCLTDILTQADRKEFVTRARALYTNTARSSPDVFTISLTSLLGAPIPLFCALHRSIESDLIICEFESAQRVIHPKQPQDGGIPSQPIHVIDSQATDAERLLSTTRRSNPLHALEIARSSSRQFTLMDLFQILSEIQDQLSASTELSNLFDVIVSLVQDLTGFHRVMVYRFDETAAGSVVSEIVDPRASKDLYRGLHFPASDIPKQARELYTINTIRILYDRDEDTARLICRTFDDAKTPLNLKHSYLRAMSPIHLKYLANMGVQASMSISLIVDNKLWGLISCHNYGSGSGISITLPIREICRGIGRIASSNIQKLLFSSRINARRPLAKAPPKSSPFAYITSSTSDLLNMFGADFGFLVIRGEARTIGKLFAYSEAIYLLQYIRHRAQPGIFYSHAVGKDLPDLNYPPGFSIISGMLVIPLSLSGTDFLVFFRKGKLKEINWAGNPYEKQVAAGTEYLEPRSSFKRWSENVIGTSREWTEDEVESAAVLTTLYGRFIEVWRQKEAIVQRNRMTRLLIRNAGHEVRTPLNSIINYMEVALEENLDERARYHLQKSLQASKSLVFVVNDLLQLTEAEHGDFQIHEDNLDLRSMLSEVVAAFREEALRKNSDIRIKDDEAVPQLVRSDPAGLRQVVSNLLANALQSSFGGHVDVGLQLIQTTQANFMIIIFFKDYGTGLSEQQLDSIFQDFEQILDDEETPASSEQIAKEKLSRPLQIGLGLATTARFVRHHSGQISMSSEGQGKGTNVSITIPFRKALTGNFSKRQTSSEITLPTPPSDILSLKALNPSATPSSSLTSLPADAIVTSPSSPDLSTVRYPFPTSSVQDERHKFNVLVAEDNPLNSRLLENRLRRRGHAVQTVVDGKSCFDAFKSSPKIFDVILMDIQMPLIDGLEATRLIREFETDSSSIIELSPRVVRYGRIPIIAVSASLSEQRIHEYLEIGFDGWVVKPIDFKRLEAILVAIEDEQMREVLLYGGSSWDKGGWFKVKANDSTNNS